MQNIRTAEKKLKNGRVKSAGPSSYGHAAKVLDITGTLFAPRFRRDSFDSILSAL